MNLPGIKRDRMKQKADRTLFIFLTIESLLGMAPHPSVDKSSLSSVTFHFSFLYFCNFHRQWTLHSEIQIKGSKWIYWWW